MSEILSIAEAKPGVENIVGIDINRAAVKAAQNNIKINNVEDNIIPQLPEFIEDKKTG